MKAYLDILRQIKKEGVLKENRTGMDTIATTGVMFRHDMAEGFPLLTTKRTAYKNVRSELEFFIQGNTDKKWLQDQGNHIWDDWCNPKRVPYGHDEETKAKMRAERDLGPIYGFQWRHWNAEYDNLNTDYSGNGIDQLKNLVDTLKKNPMDRRMIVNAWNPGALSQQALPPCHYGFQVTVLGDKLNLSWNQRSVDTPLGLPFNIASYATLLHLLAKEGKFQEGILTGFLQDTHIYVNQMEGIEEQLSREPRTLPRIETEDFTTIFDWKHSDTKLVGYDPYPPIKFPIAV